MIEVLSVMLQRLEATREALKREVRGLPDQHLNARPKREKWSIMQNLHHLHLIEQAVASSIEDALRRDERKQAKQKPVELTLDRSNKVEAPEQVRPTQTLMKEEQILRLLQRSRDHLLHILHTAEEAQLLENSSYHPVFGNLSLCQWLEFLDLHEKRHILQIQEAKRAWLPQ